MNRNSNILEYPKLPILSDEEAGKQFSKWSYVNIYSLKDLKDIYLISRLVKEKTVKNITKKRNELMYKNEVWGERKILEYLNALVKFDILDSDYNSYTSFFTNSQINEELTDENKDILRNIFFKYFRFKELSSWFISPDPSFHKTFSSLTEEDYIYNSNLLFYYSEKNRFTDTFLYDKYEKKFIIENDVLMRFWDVFLKWGTTLKILEKFNLSPLENDVFADISNKSLSVAYFIKPFKEFDLIKFLLKEFNTKYIWMPEVIFRIARKYRYAIPDIKEFVISMIREKDELTYERTSEIFLIKGKNTQKAIDMATYLFPKMNDSYISTLILRQ